MDKNLENFEQFLFEYCSIYNEEHILTVSDIITALDPFEYYSNGLGNIGYSSFED